MIKLTSNQLKNKSLITGDTVTDALNNLRNLSGDGTGDMLKAIYDSNSDGIVDRAEVADYIEWVNIGSKPATFAPSVHNHSISEITSLQTSLDGKEPSVVAGTISQYWRGDKSWNTLDKSAVGLGNVDNTSDVAKPISSNTAEALAGKEPTITAGTTAQYWRGNKTWRDFSTDVRASTLTGLSTSPNSAITDTDTVLTALGKLQAQIAAGTGVTGSRNKIINGGFDVWQRGTSRPCGTDAATAYVSDRWMGVRGGFVAGATVSQQSAGLTGFRYCARVQRNSGDVSTAAINFEQCLETSASIPLQGAAVTVSFYARCGANYSAASSALDVKLISGTGVDQNALVGGGFTSAANAINQAASLTTAWQRFSYTVILGANITQLSLRLSFTPVGTAGASDYFEVTGVQIEVGSAATPFEHRPYGAELALCQRYYYRLAPASAGLLGSGQAFLTTQAYVTVNFPVTMRATPSALEHTGVAADYSLSGINCSVAPSLNPASTNASGLVVFQIGSAALTVYSYYQGLTTAANKFLGFSAEL